MVVSLLFTALIISWPSAAPGQEPTPPPDPIQEFFAVPSGPLPWALPQPPNMDVEITLPDLSFEPVVHSPGYEDQIIDIDDRFDGLADPLISLYGSADDLKDALPDISGEGDFSTGLSPTGDPMTAYEVAADIGEYLGTAWQYARAAQQMGLGSTVYLVTFLLVAIAWLLFMEFISIMIQAIIAIIDLAVKLFDLIKGLALAFLAGA